METDYDEADDGGEVDVADDGGFDDGSDGGTDTA